MNFAIKALLVILSVSALANGEETPALRGGVVPQQKAEGLQRRRRVKKDKWYIARRLLPNVLNTCTPQGKLEIIQQMTQGIASEAHSFSDDIRGPEFPPDTDLSDVADRFVDFMDVVSELAIDTVGTCWAGKALIAGAYGAINDVLTDALEHISSVELRTQRATIGDVGQQKMRDFGEKAMDGANGFLNAIMDTDSDGFHRMKQHAQMEALRDMIMKWRDATDAMRTAVDRVEGGRSRSWTEMYGYLNDYVEQTALLM
jgi:hypothetical protein